MKIVKRILLGLVALFILIGIIIANSEGEASNENTAKADQAGAPALATPSAPKKKSEPAPVEIFDIKWGEIAAIYALGSKVTDMKKDARWKEFKGKRVKWTGRVSEISDDWTGFTMQVQMSKDSFGSDVIVRLRKSEKEKAAELNQGEKVTFIATLKDWGTLMPVTMEDGEIVK